MMTEMLPIFLNVFVLLAVSVGIPVAMNRTPGRHAIPAQIALFGYAFASGKLLDCLWVGKQDIVIYPAYPFQAGPSVEYVFFAIALTNVLFYSYLSCGEFQQGIRSERTAQRVLYLCGGLCAALGSLGLILLPEIIWR